MQVRAHKLDRAWRSLSASDNPPYRCNEIVRVDVISFPGGTNINDLEPWRHTQGETRTMDTNEITTRSGSEREPRSACLIAVARPGRPDRPLYRRARFFAHPLKPTARPRAA